MPCLSLLVSLALSAAPDAAVERKVLGEAFGVTVLEPVGPWSPKLPEPNGTSSASGASTRVTSGQFSYSAQRLNVSGVAWLEVARLKGEGGTRLTVRFDVVRGRVRLYLAYVNGLSAYLLCDASAGARCTLEGGAFSPRSGVRAVVLEALDGSAELANLQVDGR